MLGLGWGEAFNFCRPSGGFKNRPALLSARLHFPVAFEFKQVPFGFVDANFSICLTGRY